LVREEASIRRQMRTKAIEQPDRAASARTLPLRELFKQPGPAELPSRHAYWRSF
jgi:hypothetical protein